MGKVVVSQFITLDGVVEDPGGAEDFDRRGWAFEFDRGSEGDQFKYEELMASGVLLRSEEHTSELQSRQYLVCRLLLEKKKNNRSHDVILMTLSVKSC